MTASTANAFPASAQETQSVAGAVQVVGSH